MRRLCSGRASGPRTRDAQRVRLAAPVRSAAPDDARSGAPRDEQRADPGRARPLPIHRAPARIRAGVLLTGQSLPVVLRS